MRKLYKQFILNACYPYGILEFCYALGRVCKQPASNKNLWHWVSKELLWYATFSYVLSQFISEELSASCVTPLGGNSWKFAPGVHLQTSLHVPFFLCWFCFVFFHYKSYPRIQLYVKTWIFLVSHWTCRSFGDPQCNSMELGSSFLSSLIISGF